MIIFCDHITPRLRYSATFVVNDVFARELFITNDPGQMQNHPGPVISYSKIPVEGSYHIVPSGLLDETGTRDFEPGIQFLGNIPLLFPSIEGDLNFDLFSAVFYMLSRYEEYLEFQPDMHGRFSAVSSIAWRKGFLELPVVNIWIRRMAKDLEKRFHGLKLTMPEYQFVPSIDIDTAWQVKNRSIIRTTGALIKSLLNIRISDFFERAKILTGRLNDPADSFDFIMKNHPDGNLRIFMLAGNGGRYDNNNPVGNKNWQALARKLSSSFLIGMHPSYYVKEKRGLLLKEKQLMEKVSGKAIVRSRQHFLRLFFPATYRQLCEIGIKEDYTMGYADKPGFRAGTSFPFRFYDLETEEETALRIFPFVVMDRTLKDYMKLNPDEAIEKVKSIASRVKEHGGNFTPIWHNDSLSDQGEWEGWRKVYEEILSL